MDTNTLGYIIGGSVGGFCLIVIVGAIIAYCTCGKKRKSKRNGEKKFRPLPTESGRQSQASTLSHIDPRSLPKVGNGLWVEAPTVYQVAPNQGLYYGRPNHKYRVEPGVQRSSSELRLQAGAQPGHAVYQGNVRIYHSQQLAPVYEVVDTSRAPGLISVYEYNDLNQSTSRLIGRNSAERQHRDSKKIKRSQSDVSGRHKRDNSKRQANSNEKHKSEHRDHHREPQHSRASSSTSSNLRASHKSQSMEAAKGSGYDNKAFEIQHDPYTITTTLGPVAATDSMKLQDKRQTNPLYNKTDDEKQDPKPEAKHYVYEGSIYALPSKPKPEVQNRPKQEVKAENPIVELMDAMILEKTESSSKRSSASSQIRPTEVTVPAHVKDSSSIRIERTQPDTGEPIDTVDASIHTPISATQSDDLGPTGNQVTAEAFKFLDTYLGSDDEGPDSPPLSPGGGRIHTGF